MPKGGFTEWNEKGAKEALSAQEKLLAAKEKQLSVDQNLENSLSDMVKHGVKINKAQKDFLKMAESTAAVVEKTEDIEDNIHKQMRNKNKAMQASGILNKNMLKTLQDQAKNGELTKKQAEEFAGIVQDLSGSMQSVADIQKVIDDLGDDINEDMREYLEGQKEIAKIQEQQKGFMEGLDELSGGMASKAGDFVELMKNNPMAAQLAVATAVLTKFSGQVDAIGESFGAIGVSDFAGDLMAADAQLAKLGYDAGTATEITKELSENFGYSVEDATALAANVGKLSKGLGLSVGEGAKLLGTLTQIGGLSEKQALDMAAQANSLALQNNVNPQAVMADIANSGEMFAKFGKDGGKALMEGAILAKKMGTNLAAVESTMESMLDFQSSTTKAMEASMMIGRDLNVQKLQELSLAGDAAGVLEEQKRLLGDAEKFNSMNVLQRKALAEALGLTVEQASKMVNAEEEMLDKAKEMEKEPGFENLVSKDTMSSMSQMIASLESMAATLTNVLGPPLNFVVGVIGEMVGWIGWLVEGLNSIAGPMGTAGIATALFGKRLLVTAVTGVWSGLSYLWSIPVVGPALAIATGVAGVAAIYKQLAGAKAQKVEDASIPSSGGPVVTTPEGQMFEGIANDDVLMAPGIAGAQASVAAAGGGGNGAVVAAINNLNTTTQANKPPSAKQIGKRTTQGIESASD